MHPHEHLTHLNPVILVAANLLFLALPLACFLVPGIRVRMFERNGWPVERSTASGRAYGRAAYSAMFGCVSMILFVDWLTFFDTRTSFRNIGLDLLLPPLFVTPVLFVLTPLFAWPRWALYSKFRDDRGLIQEGIQWLRDRRARPHHRADRPRRAAQGLDTQPPEVPELPARTNISYDD